MVTTVIVALLIPTVLPANVTGKVALADAATLDGKVPTEKLAEPARLIAPTYKTTVPVFCML